jgi:hypothetical protein
MANTFKNAGMAITTTPTDLFTASTQTVIHALYVSNIHGTNSGDVDIEITIDGGTTYYHIAKTVPVPADSTLVLDKPINLEASDKIRFTAAVNSTLEVVASYLEIT